MQRFPVRARSALRTTGRRVRRFYDYDAQRLYPAAKLVSWVGWTGAIAFAIIVGVTVEIKVGPELQQISIKSPAKQKPKPAPERVAQIANTNGSPPANLQAIPIGDAPAVRQKPNYRAQWSELTTMAQPMELSSGNGVNYDQRLYDNHMEAARIIEPVRGPNRRR